MANAAGIEYYPFNVDFFEDDKIALIEEEFGYKGVLIAIRLLCKIYREGYFYRWGKDECQLFARKLGAGLGRNMVNEVVSGLLRRSFFDKGVYEQFGILTSRGIQLRYFDAVKRRAKVDAIREYLLVDVTKLTNVTLVSLDQSRNGNQKRGERSVETEEKPASQSHKPLSTVDVTPPDTVEAEISQLMTRDVWIESVAMRFHLGVEQIRQRLRDFAIDCRARGTEKHNGMNDAQRHFNDWLRIQLNFEQQKSNINDDKNEKSRRRPNNLVTAGAEDYKRTF